MRNTHGAKKKNYPGIMLNALKGQLCSKLCRHNIHTPTTETNFLHSHLCLSNFVTNGSSRLSDTAIEYAKPLFAIATNSNLDHIHMMSLNWYKVWLHLLCLKLVGPSKQHIMCVQCSPTIVGLAQAP